MLNYNEMSKEMLIAHIQTMDMQLNAFAKAGAEKEYRIAALERQLQDHSAQAFSIGETYANALSRIAELEAQIASASAPVVEQQPAGYIRKWAFDGEKPEKRLNANNRMAWPGKFKFFPVTQAKILPDDIPLYVAPQAADTEKLLEAILSLPLPRPNFYDTTLRQDAYSIGQVNMILRSAADLVASTALQAPVSEVPGWQPIETAPKDGQEILIRYPLQGNVKQLASYNTIHNHWQSKGGYVWAVEQKCEWHPLPDDLPAAPVQKGGE